MSKQKTSAQARDDEESWKAAVWEARVAALNEKNAMRTALPIGRAVEWTHGNHLVSGVVVDHGYGADNVIVRGDRSGKEYHLSAFRILHAMGLNPPYPR